MELGSLMAAPRLPIDLNRYKKLKDEVANAQRVADRAQGALSQVMASIKEEYGCDTLPEAEALLKTLEKKAAKSEKEYHDALTEFERDWGDKLKHLSGAGG
jgi:multidrug resistance efflux pump